MNKNNSAVNTDCPPEIAQTQQEQNLLLVLIKELCSDNEISEKLKGKVTRIIADCDLTHHTSLYKLSAADESTTSLIGFMKQTTQELTFDEQSELNQAIINKINTKLPLYIKELDYLQNSTTQKRDSLKQIKNLQKNLDEKLTKLQEQENEKVELMMEWLNHRVNEVSQYNTNNTELLSLKTKVLELKSKILHLQILQNIYTETNQSLKSYREVHKDLQDSMKESQENIKKYKQIIDSDFSQYV